MPKGFTGKSGRKLNPGARKAKNVGRNNKRRKSAGGGGG